MLLPSKQKRVLLIHISCSEIVWDKRRSLLKLLTKVVLAKEGSEREPVIKIG